MGRTKAQRLMREVSQLKPGDNVTLRVYANGQYKEVAMKVARAGDLPRSRGMTYFGGWDFPPVPPIAPVPPLPRAFRTIESFEPIRLEMTPELGEKLAGVRARIDAMRPQLERMRIEAPKMRVQLGRGMEL